jgi:hypothetical protein
MKKTLLITVLSLLASTTTLYAKESEFYPSICGTKARLEKDMQTKIEGDLLLEIIAGRKIFLNIVQKGQLAIDEILSNQTNESYDPLYLFMTCNGIKEAKNEIKKLGCVDIETGKVIKDNGGIKACEDFLVSLPQ